MILWEIALKFWVLEEFPLSHLLHVRRESPKYKNFQVTVIF